MNDKVIILATRDKMSLLLLNWPHKLMSFSDLLRNTDFIRYSENISLSSLHFDYESAAPYSSSASIKEQCSYLSHNAREGTLGQN